MNIIDRLGISECVLMCLSFYQLKKHLHISDTKSVAG